MSDKNFTSGERRGLIALLVVITIILAVAVISRSCHAGPEPAAIDAPAAALHDSIRGAVDSVSAPRPASSSKKKKKNGASAGRRTPDGKKRNYLSEPV